MNVLSPQDAPKTDAVWSPQSELDISIRNFGKYPNVHDWLPGDVLLVRSMKPDWITGKIIAIQSRGYAYEHACWQHAAIYMGNGYVAEATTGGVKYSPILKYIGKHALRLRRNPLLENNERWLVAIEAGVRLRAAYGFLDILEIYRRSFPGLSRQLSPSVVLQGKSVICSQLCYDAHAALGLPIVPDAVKRPVVPAALSLTLKLTDVELFWQKIA